MKQSQNSGTMQQSQSRNKPENKDNLDSRHKEEEMVKGDHITNNHKEQQSAGKQQKQQQ
ncbi:hypothetical protein MUK70_08950 [Dyadobacter chenwenxiniae]|uniref:Uncharacterized protein n=1 Tax=Dyadobacter chenwenxiniae TaxID=2906456 RepID=A0A9X1PMD9_9BACT|nr:hypothetical protein [Dyadobacter chenwenxiniae]MCF0051980.1 hypothetical protein [Dyadobacter chenwenxiniae]MCF0063511.1 hypothetical protein [Dyadobacter chenwenxiniae]UON85109.1 hypothetical protein MUK70_08950 [Dyadobacter chenwenxiniae]